MRALLSPPNLLTCARFALTPFIVLSLMDDQCVAAFWLSVIAGSTDAADGYLARLWGQATQIGAYLDPIADKILLTALYVCFGVVGLAPWWLVWLVVGRDVMILSLAGMGFYWRGLREFPPSMWGKLSTLMQIAAAVVIISRCAYGVSPALVDVFIYATACSTAWSGFHYLFRAVSTLSSVSR